MMSLSTGVLLLRIVNSVSGSGNYLVSQLSDSCSVLILTIFNLFLFCCIIVISKYIILYIG